MLAIRIYSTETYNDPYTIVKTYVMVCFQDLSQTMRTTKTNMNTMIIIIVKITVFVTTVLKIMINNEDYSVSKPRLI